MLTAQAPRSGGTGYDSALDRMIVGQLPWNMEFLVNSTRRLPTNYRFPTALGLRLWDEGKAVEALSYLREARNRLLLHLETHPNDKVAFEELPKLEQDLAEAEAALSST